MNLKLAARLIAPLLAGCFTVSAASYTAETVNLNPPSWMGIGPYLVQLTQTTYSSGSTSTVGGPAELLSQGSGSGSYIAMDESAQAYWSHIENHFSTNPNAKTAYGVEQGSGMDRILAAMYIYQYDALQDFWKPDNSEKSDREAILDLIGTTRKDHKADLSDYMRVQELEQTAYANDGSLNAADFQFLAPSGHLPGDIAPALLTFDPSAATATPEPGSTILLGSGLALVGLVFRKRIYAFKQ